MQTHKWGTKETGCTDFQSWKKSQQEKERKVSWEPQLLDATNISETEKAVRRCGTRTRVHCDVFAFSEHSEKQQHNSVD